MKAGTVVLFTLFLPVLAGPPVEAAEFRVHELRELHELLDELHELRNELHELPYVPYGQLRDELLHGRFRLQLDGCDELRGFQLGKLRGCDELKLDARLRRERGFNFLREAPEFHEWRLRRALQTWQDAHAHAHAPELMPELMPESMLSYYSFRDHYFQMRKTLIETFNDFFDVEELLSVEILKQKLKQKLTQQDFLREVEKFRDLRGFLGIGFKDPQYLEEFINVHYASTSTKELKEMKTKFLKKMEKLKGMKDKVLQEKEEREQREQEIQEEEEKEREQEREKERGKQREKQRERERVQKEIQEGCVLQAKGAKTGQRSIILGLSTLTIFSGLALLIFWILERQKKYSRTNIKG